MTHFEVQGLAGSNSIATLAQTTFASVVAVAASNPNVVELVAQIDASYQLKLVATLIGDRFHTKLLGPFDEENCWFRSVEGGNDELWPDSPPLQELIPQTDIDGNPYLAGIGRAGKSHWSVVVDSQVDGGGFNFDFACLVKTEPGWIGSTFESTGSVEVTSKTTALISFAHDKVIRLSANPESARIRNADGRLQVEARLRKDLEFPASHRWQFSIEYEV